MFKSTKTEDLRVLCRELRITFDETNTIPELKNFITEHEEYKKDTEFIKMMLTTIIEDRRQKEDAEERKRKEDAEERKRIEDAEREERKRREEMEFELRKLELELKRLEIARNDSGSLSETNKNDYSSRKMQLAQVTTRFDEKKDEMELYLINFERKALMAQVPKDEWVAYLLAVLPVEVCNMIGRESPENANNYEFVKERIMKRYKMNVEKLKQCFYRHQKSPEKTWETFALELSTYFTEWITAMKVETFDALKNLMVAEQLKRRTPDHIKEHFLDRWMQMKDPAELATKMEEYESIENSFNKREPPKKYENDGREWFSPIHQEAREVIRKSLPTTYQSMFSGFQRSTQPAAAAPPAEQFGASNFALWAKSEAPSLMPQQPAATAAPAGAFGTAATMQPMFISTPAGSFGKVVENPGFNFAAAASSSAPVLFQFGGNVEKKTASQFAFGAPSQEAATPSSFSTPFNMSSTQSFNFGSAPSTGAFRFAESSTTDSGSNTGQRKIRKTLRRVPNKH